MGIFDRFKKQKNEVPMERPVTQRTPYEVTLDYMEDGKLVIELCENFYEEGRFYDTTRLIIDNNPVMLCGKPVQNCMVSWYGSDDAILLGQNEFESGRRGEYENVLAEIDPNLLQDDPNYSAYVLKALLNRKRVEQYLGMGMQDNPERPCGKYVGGIYQKEGQYKKIFKPDMGREAHNSREMRMKRENLKMQQQKRMMEVRERKRAEIARLQREINELDEGR